MCQHMHLPMQRRRCEGARRRAHIDIDSESLIRVTGRGRCSPHMRSVHKRMCARTQVTQHACMPRMHARTRTHTHGGTHPHVTRDPSIHSHHATPRTRTRNQACLRLNIPMHEYIILLHYYYYLLFIIYSGCHAHARMYSFFADVHRIYEWGMLRATIAPAPCRPLHVVRLA